ncbi:MAG: XRE family transcriptional regulator [Nitrospinales bacterium]
MDTERLRDIGSRFKFMRESLCLSQQQLSEKIGFPQQTISRIESGQQKPAESILKILKYLFNVDRSWLMDGSGELEMDFIPIGRALAGGTDETFLKLIEAHERCRGSADIPIYNAWQNPGSGSLDTEKHLVIHREWIQNKLGVVPQKLVAVTVSGDSMEPTLKNGDVILVNLNLGYLMDNAIYVLNVDGTLLVKRIERLVAGGVVLRSDNKLVSPDQNIDNEQAGRLDIVGRVVWFGRHI